MIAHDAVLLALRTRLLTLSVCTTGSVTLAATATGYSRATGSFLTDGLAPGMEITPTGFSANTVDVLTGVTALTLTTRNVRAVETASAGRAIAVGLPAGRAWENVAFDPSLWTGRPWVEEDYVPGPAAQVTAGERGDVETWPQYILKLYGPPKVGGTALHRYGDAVLKLFPPRLGLALATGEVVRVGEKPAPYRSQLVPDAAGSAVVVTIPCSVRSANSI